MTMYAKHWKQLNARKPRVPPTLDIALCALIVSVEVLAILLAVAAITGTYA